MLDHSAFEDAPDDVLLELFQGFIPTDVQHLVVNQLTVYYGYHRSWDEVPEGAQAPEYLANITREDDLVRIERLNGSVTFVRRDGTPSVSVDWQKVNQGEGNTDNKEILGNRPRRRNIIL